MNMLPILALAGYEEIHEGAAGVGAYPATGGELAPYAAGFCRPGTYRWPNGTCRPYRPTGSDYRGYVSGPKSPLSGWDEMEPTTRYVIAGVGAAVVIGAVFYFTSGHEDAEPSGWDKAFTPNRSRRRRRGKKRWGRKSRKFRGESVSSIMRDYKVSKRVAKRAKKYMGRGDDWSQEHANMIISDSKRRGKRGRR